MIKVNALGTLGADADLGQTKQGTEVCRFSVAVNKRVKTEVTTVWLKCSLFGSRAPKLQQYLTKGTKVYIEGDPSLNSWTDKNGNTRTDFTVMVSELQLLGGGTQSQRNAAPRGEVQPDLSSMPSYVSTLTDEDIPF